MCRDNFDLYSMDAQAELIFIIHFCRKVQFRQSVAY